MGAEIQDIYIEQGVDFTFNLTLEDFAGVQYDLDLYTLSGSIKIDTFTYEMTFTEVIGVTGAVIMSIDAATTSTIPKGKGRYAINITEDLTGEVDRLVKGRAYIDEGI
jgi:hypothetical protein